MLGPRTSSDFRGLDGDMLERTLRALMGLVLVLPVSAQTPGDAPRSEPALKPGSLAPPLRAQRWLSERTAPKFETGKLYVLDFLADWMPASQRNAPWMARLRGKYAGKVQFVGVACESTEGNRFENLQRAAAARPELFDFPIAWDSDGHAFHAYIEASGINAYPTAFVIDGARRVVFCGHPRLLDDVLALVVAGKWDLEKGNARAAAAWTRQAEMLEHYDQEPETVLTAIDDFVDREGFAGTFRLLRYHCYRRTEQHARAAEICGPLLEEALFTDDAASLTEMAWCIVDPSYDCHSRDVDLSLRAALRAVELTEEKDFLPLDTLARCYAWKGEYAKSVELEEKALALTPEKDVKEIEATLAEYRKKLAKK